jgi:methionyl-tRNA formyltransferase
MHIGVAATPDVAIPTLDWLQNCEHELVRVISQPDRPAGRGQSLKSSAVSQWALAAGVELVRPLAIEDLNRVISDLDLLVTIGYGRILPEQSISLPTFGCINLHFSLLPQYRGAAPVQRALEAGEKQTGVTVFKLDPGMDTGPIYSSRVIDIDPCYRSSEVFTQLSLIGVDAVKEAIELINAGSKPYEQTGKSSHAGKISKEEAKIDWKLPSSVTLNKIRGFYPAPVAWTIFRDQSLKISSAKIHSQSSALELGEILLSNTIVLIGTKDGALEVDSVIPAGKKEMSGVEWARGARFESGERCG